MSAIPVESRERTDVINLLKQYGWEVDNLSSGLVMHRQDSLSAHVDDDGVYFQLHDMNRTPRVAGDLFFDFRNGTKSFQILLQYLK